eukprot:TRINITY_DN2979_c0_g1_i4.p1 TRINITY_DN2979_c0_g1~~TRINITY_DN2979_c0_g1_i4.p1  ORF type:complete len:264 (-),score=45.20 TRINITY_DN2979_c0_g1_i4:328-1119(-)
MSKSTKGKKGKKNNVKKNQKTITDERPVEIRLKELLETDPGKDNDGNEYSSFLEMWKKHFAHKDGSTKPEGIDEELKLVEENWYGKSTNYWEGIPATVDGMLGGFEDVSNPDVRGSYTFVIDYVEGTSKHKLGSPIRALDVGAGIGRITQLLLSRIADKVDLLEQNPNFLKEAKEVVLKDHPNVDSYLCFPMQKFQFTKKYDLIWVQWVVIYLTDEDFISFFSVCTYEVMGAVPLKVIKQWREEYLDGNVHFRDVERHLIQME